MASTPAPSPPAAPVRSFGRFELRQLLGKSTAAMVWLARDPRSGNDVMLTMPRAQPIGAQGHEHWLNGVRGASRLIHPNLARVAEIGVNDQWPFIVVEREQWMTLGEWFAAHPNASAVEVVGWVCQLLRGLAFAHEAGVTHADPQLHSVLINDRGHICLMGLAVADGAAHAAHVAHPAGSPGAAAPDPADRQPAMSSLQAQRAGAAHDLLACGLLLHHLLTGQPALEQADTALVATRIAPLGRELVRLPWTTRLPVPEALRAIANRCTSGQVRLHYTIARTLLGALTGWLDAQAQEGGGPLTLLLDRLRTVGVLPALPGLAARVASVTGGESQRTDEIADQVLADMALSFELIRTLNTAQVQGTQVQGGGPVLTLRRIISLIGVNGVRLAANSLRQWPGPLSVAHAASLMAAMERARHAGQLAQALRPPGSDAQVIYLVTVMQSLGRLMLRYHFADEADQMQQLMTSNPKDPNANTSEQPGLSEEAAAYAVMGVDVESLGSVVSRNWGLGDDLLLMTRRLAPNAVVRKPDTDVDFLRLMASAANDCVDAIYDLPPTRTTAALTQVAQRYSRALGITMRDINDGLLSAGILKNRQAMTPDTHAADAHDAPEGGTGEELKRNRGLDNPVHKFEPSSKSAKE